MNASETITYADDIIIYNIRNTGIIGKYNNYYNL